MQPDSNEKTPKSCGPQAQRIFTKTGSWSWREEVLVWRQLTGNEGKCRGRTEEGVKRRRNKRAWLADKWQIQRHFEHSKPVFTRQPVRDGRERARWSWQWSPEHCQKAVAEADAKRRVAENWGDSNWIRRARPLKSYAQNSFRSHEPQDRLHENAVTQSFLEVSEAHIRRLAAWAHWRREGSFLRESSDWASSDSKQVEWIRAQTACSKNGQFSQDNWIQHAKNSRNYQPFSPLKHFFLPQERQNPPWKCAGGRHSLRIAICLFKKKPVGQRAS